MKSSKLIEMAEIITIIMFGVITILAYVPRVIMIEAPFIRIIVKEVKENPNIGLLSLIFMFISFITTPIIKGRERVSLVTER